MIWTEQQIRRALDGTFTSIRVTADGYHTVTQKKPKDFIPDFSVTEEKPRIKQKSGGPRVAWTQDDYEQAWEMWLARTPITQIAEKLGRNYQSTKDKLVLLRIERGWA